MLSLDKRPCLVAKSRGDISLTGIMLESHELNRLLEDEGAWSSWFTARAGNLPEPAAWTKHLRRFAHAEKFEDSQAIICVGGAATSIALEKVKISNVRLTPQIGGLTELSLTCTPASECAASVSEWWCDELADVQLTIGKSDGK